MPEQGSTMDSDSARRAIDRHAVTAAGHLLVSAIWLEQRVRSFSAAHLPTSPLQRGSLTALANSSAAHQRDPKPLVLEGRSD
jgi:hypothetical protein